MLTLNPNPRFDEAERLKALRRYDILDTPPDGSFDRITSMAAKLLKVPIAIVSLVDRDRIWFKSHHGLEVQQIDREPGLCASAILSPEVYVLTDARTDVRSLTNPLVAGEFGLRFYAAAPLTTYDGHNLGTLCVIDKQPRLISSEELELLQDLAALVIDEIELRRAALNIDRLNTQLEQEVVERKRAELAAHSANQAKSEFLANMSHELRTPLNGILGYTQILQRDKEATPKQQEAIAIINQCGSHLLTLINDILDLSKIEARKLELAPTTFHFDAFLKGVVEICRIKAEQKNIAFTEQILNQLPTPIYADDKRLRQVLINLLGNALKFTDTGGVTLKVGVTETRKTPIANTPLIHKIRFQVEDTGIGMNAEQLKKIFLPFEQVGNRDRKAQGTGLGLAITQKLVQMMGGQLHVESSPGVGSTFWVEVDLPESLDEVDAQPLPASLTIIGYEGKKQKLLVIDDCRENRSVLVNLLEPLGFELIEASNGQEGLETAIATQPDLIIVDLVMPVIDGLEMTRQLRQLPEFQDIPVIASSASVFKFDRQQSQQSGCNDFLPKPIQFNELFEKLQTYLNLQWLYENQAPVSASKSLEMSSNLVIPPASELASLRAALEIGDFDKLEKEAIRIQQLDKNYLAFSTKLLQFAQEFDEEEIMKLLKPTIAGE